MCRHLRWIRRTSIQYNCSGKPDKTTLDPPPTTTRSRDVRRDGRHRHDLALILARLRRDGRHRHDLTLTRWTLMQKTETDLGGADLSTRRRVINSTIALIKHEEAEAEAARGRHANKKLTTPDFDDGARDYFAVGVATGLGVPCDGVRATGVCAGSVIVEASVTVDGDAEAAAACASLLTEPAKPLGNEFGPCAVPGVRVDELAASAVPEEVSAAAPAEAPAEPAPPPDAEELPTDAQLALALRAVYARHRHDRTLTWRTLVQKTETELGSVGLSTRRHIIKTTIELIKHEEAEAKAARASHAADDDEPPVVMFHALGGSPVGADAADEQAAADRAPPPRPRAGSDIAETSVTVDDGAEAAAAFVSGVRVKRRGSASPAKASADPPPSPPPPAPASTSSGRGLSSSSGNTTPVARSAARARQQREEERQHKPTLIMDLAR